MVVKRRWKEERAEQHRRSQKGARDEPRRKQQGKHGKASSTSASTAVLQTARRRRTKNGSQPPSRFVDVRAEHSNTAMSCCVTGWSMRVEHATRAALSLHTVERVRKGVPLAPWRLVVCLTPRSVWLQWPAMAVCPASEVSELCRQSGHPRHGPSACCPRYRSNRPQSANLGRNPEHTVIFIRALPGKR